MQSDLLEQYPNEDLRVYVVWFNMLATDRRSRWDDRLITDDRAIHFWDEERLAGFWFAESTTFSGPIAWDIYYLYGPDAEWVEEPAPLVSWGYTLLGKREQLLADLVPMFE